MYLSIKAMYNTWPDGRLDFISKYAYLCNSFDATGITQFKKLDLRFNMAGAIE